jgi:hypothetical protein
MLHFARSLAEDGRRRCKGCAGSDAALAGEHELDIYQQFVPESQRRVVGRLTNLVQ